MPTSSSLKIAGNLCLTGPNNSTNFFQNAATASFSCTFKINALASPYQAVFVGSVANGSYNIAGNFIGQGEAAGTANVMSFAWGPSAFVTSFPYQYGGTYFIAASWVGGSLSSLWVNDYNGTPLFTTTAGASNWAGSNALAIGSFDNQGESVNYQIQDLAISPSYAFTAGDVLNLRNQTLTAIQIDPSFSYWPLGGGTIGATLTLSDAGLLDANSRAMNFETVTLPGLSSATYAAPLIYVPPTTVVPYVTKSGKLTMFFGIDAGSSTPQPVTANATTPAINVQFGGTGGFNAIDTWGPLTTTTDVNLILNNQSVVNGGHYYPFVAYQNICGPVESIAVQLGGHSYSSSPTASVSGGGGSGCVLGTPVVTGGVTSFSGISDAGGHGSPPAVTVTGDGFGAQATANLTGTTVTSLTVFWPGYSYTHATASWSGGSATGVVSNCIRSIPVTTHGSGYTSTPTVTITDGTGTGALAVAVMGGVQSGDVVTYSGVSDGWFTTTSGIAAGTSGSSVANYSGSLEPGVGGYTNFGAGPNGTCKFGFNTTFVTAGTDESKNLGVNWWKRAALYGPVATSAANGRPLTTTATVGSPLVLDFQFAITGSGVWTMVADEIAPSTPMSVAIQTEFPGNFTVSSAVVAAGTSTTGVTSITLTAGGSGWTDRPRVTLTGGGGSGATAYCKINAAGAIIGIYLLSVGTGYTSAPSVAFTSSDGNGSGATATTTTGSVINGKTWQFTVTMASGIDTFSISTETGFSLAIWAPGGVGTYAYSLYNEFLFSPQDTAAAAPSYPSRSNPLRASQDIKTWLVSPNGNGPSLMRFMDSCWPGACTSRAVLPSHLPDANDWVFQRTSPLAGTNFTLDPTAGRLINITTVRTWATSSSQSSTWPSGWGVSWVSPNVYLPEQGVNGVVNSTFAGYGSSGDTSGPYYVDLDTVGTNQTIINYRNSSMSQGDVFVGEAITSAPHNLQIGQIVGFSSGTGTFNFATNNSGGTSAFAVNQFNPWFVVPTSATSFAFAMPASTTAGQSGGFPGAVYNVAGTFSVNFDISVQVPDPSTISPEDAAGIVTSLGNGAILVNIPFAATEALAAAVFRRTRDIMPKGSQTYVEFSNENWNNGQLYSGQFCWTMGNLTVWGTGIAGDGNIPYTARAAQIHAVAVATYNATDINGNTNRGGEIFRVFGDQFGNGVLADQVNYLNAHSLPANGFASADYEDIPYNFTAGGVNIATALASVASHWPTSIAYQWATPWTRAAYLDYWRHGLKYDLWSHGPGSGQFGSFARDLATIAGFTGPGSPAQAIGYEGGLQQAATFPLRTGADPNGQILDYYLTHDLAYDPNIYDVFTAWFQSMQDGGITIDAIFTLTHGQVGPNNNNLWAAAFWHGEPVGKGDGSLASNGQNVTNLFWENTQNYQYITNANPRLKAYQDWQDGVNNVAATTATLSGPMTGTESVATGYYTVMLDGDYTGTVTPHLSGVTGSFTPSSLTWAGTSGDQSFTLTATATGTASVSITASPTLTLVGSPISTVISSSAATAATLSGPTTATVGVATSNFTVALNGTYSGTITPAVSGVSGSFTPTSLSGAGTFTFTATSGGTASVSITASPSLTYSGSPISVTVSSSAATTATLSGPTSATVGVATSNYTVALNGTYSGTITPAVSGVSGSFTPSTLSGAGTFTFTATSGGTASVSITASPSLTYSGSPISVTVSAGASDTLAVTGPSTWTAGTPAAIVVTADLSGGGTDTGYRGTIAFTSNDPHATLPANYTFTAANLGVRGFSATFMTAGAKTVTATDTVTGTITGTSSATSVSPGTPQSLSARSVSTSQINLSWQAAPGATAYQIQESLTGMGGWTTVGTTSGTSFAVMGLTNLTQYFFRVYGTGGGYDSLDSNVASATTGPPATNAKAKGRWFGGMRFNAARFN